MYRTALLLAVVLALIPIHALCEPSISVSINNISDGLVEYNYTVENLGNDFLTGFAIFAPLSAADINPISPSFDWTGISQALDSNTSMVSWLVDDWMNGLLYGESAVFTIQVPDTTVTKSGYKYAPYNSDWGWEVNAAGSVIMGANSIEVPGLAAVVPEPSSMASLVMTGLMAFGCLKRRRS